MRNVLVPVLALGMAMSGAALAQSSPPANSQSGQQGSGQQAGGPSNQQLLTAQKLKQDLESAGFTDVTVVAESFVVRAKTKNGDPVLMTIGPHGMAIFEAAGGASGNAGSNSGSTSSGSGARR